MSSEHGEHHEKLPPPPSDKRLLNSMVGWVGVILIFVFILFITYLPTREEGVDQARALYREQALQEVRSHEAQLLDNYSATGGQVRIPVSRAMELVLPQLNDKKVKASSTEAQPQQGNVAPSPSEATPQTAPEADQNGEDSQQGGDVTPEPEAPQVEPASGEATPAPDPGLGDSRPSDG